MLQNISTLGLTLTKKEQRLVQGSALPTCTVCFDYCSSQNFQTKEGFSACFHDCKQELC